MTPTEFAARTDAVLHYVGALLTHPEGTPEWTVGRTFALMTDRERSAYIQQLVTESPRGTRVLEIGWDLLAIIQGLPESEVAA
ncbi:hypothetical protein [Nocardia africana]